MRIFPEFLRSIQVKVLAILEIEDKISIKMI